jgi:murein DD-endopeptidase MepM/ murein hydrolase activator NlpD
VLLLLRISGYPISAGFGAIDSAHTTPHKGVDIAMPEGTPLRAIGDGIVTRVNDEGTQSFGKAIRIKLDNGTEVIYGHLSEIKAKVGQHVSTGDIVGLSGNTGKSTGAHLHIQIVAENGKLIDPTPVADAATDMSFWERWGRGLFDFSDGILNPRPEGSLAERYAMSKLERMIDVLNANSAEIVTLGIVVCAVGMMIGGFIGGSARWFGWMCIIAFLGGVWCVFV